MKKLTVILLSLLLVLSFSGCKGKKANPASDFDYTVSSSNKVVINKYLGYSTDVVIPKEIEGCPVTVIYFAAFMNTDIESITIPDTVVTIWDSAFANCQELHTVEMGEGVKLII